MQHTFTIEVSTEIIFALSVQLYFILRWLSIAV